MEGIAQTIAAYLELHGFASTTGLIVSEMDHVRTLYVFWLSSTPIPPLHRLALEPSSARIEKKKRNDRETDDAFHDSHLLVSPFFLFLPLFFLWAQVDDACSLATTAALSFDAEQANKAEWYTAYPKVGPLDGPPKQAVRRAGALPKPPPPPLSTRRPGEGTGALRHLDAREFSAFAGVTCGAVGSGRAAMSVIADIARREIEWQLRVIMRPSVCVHIDIDRRKSGSRRVGTRALSSVLLVAAAAETEDKEDEDRAGVPAARGQRGGHMAGAGGKKRKRRTTLAVDVAEAETAADSPPGPCPRSSSPPPPEPEKKRVKRASATQDFQQLYHRDRGADATPTTTTTAAAAAAVAPSGSSGMRGARGAINDGPLRRPPTPTPTPPPPPPAGPAAAFLYSLGMRQGTMNITLERGRGMPGAGRRR